MAGGQDGLSDESMVEAPGGAPDLEYKTGAGVPVFRTDAGRRVLGGGGITPDLVVPDTLNSAERALFQEVQQDVALFSNVLYEYSVEYSHEHPELQPGVWPTRSAWRRLIVRKG